MDEAGFEEAARQRLPFAEYVAAIAAAAGEPSTTAEMSVEWTRGVYSVLMTDQGEGNFVLEYRTRGEFEDGYLSATLPMFVDEKARSVAEFLAGPADPPERPKKFAADEQRILGIQQSLMHVQQQVYQMMDNRRWNRVFQEIVARNPALGAPNPLLAHFHRVFIDYEILAVRRQAKHENASVSLSGVMRDVRDAAPTITRHWHHRLWRGETSAKLVGTAGPFVTRLADDSFATFADASGERVEPTIVEADLAAFAAATDPIVHFSDKMVAHTDRRGIGEKFPNEAYNLDAAVDAVVEFTVRYSRLLLVRSSNDMVPMGPASALRAFCEPWIRSDDELKAIAAKFDLRNW